MDLAVLRERLARAIGTDDPSRTSIALVTAGVVAAGVPVPPVSWPGPRLRVWRDPSDFLERLAPAAAGDRPDDVWRNDVLVDGPIRLSVIADDGALDVVPELRSAPFVAALSVVLPEWATVPPPRGPGWSWPLRLATGPGWRTGPDGTLYDPPSWWDELVVPVPTSGRWAEASLALLGDEPEGADPVRARVVVVRGDPDAVADTGALAELARRHGAGAVAVVDPGAVPDRWIAELVAALSHDEPLDLALRTASTGYLALPPPLVLGPPGLFERARLRTVIAGASRRLATVAPAVEDRLLRGGESPVDESPDAARRRRAVAGRLGEMTGDAFLHESGDASLAAAALGESLAEIRRSPDRFLLADLFDGPTPAPAALLPDRTYQLAVRIGADESAAAAGVPAFPEVEPDSADGTLLTVVVTDLGGPDGETRAAQQTELLLPPAGDSPTVTFPLLIGPAGSLMEYRVAVLHGQRFVQTGLLRGRVGRSWRFRVEAVVHADVEELATATRHDASLVLNHTAAGAAAVAVMTPAGSFVTVSKDLTESRGLVTGPLQELVTRPGGFTGFDSEPFQDLIIELARRGRLFHDELFGVRPDRMTPEQQALSEATRISVLCADPDSVVPLEFLYDRPLRTGIGSTLTFCPGAREHLVAGDCPNTPAGVRTTVVCPIRFWAAGRILERHVVAPTAGAPSLALAPAPDAQRHAIPLGAVFAAAADRADHNDGQAWTTAAAGLDGVQLARSWEELGGLSGAQRAAGTSADVVLLVAHLIKTAQNDIELELGTGNTWSIINDFDPILELDAARNPLMIVLGCGTAVADEPLLRPPARLLDCGAPAVVASLVTVLGRHIVPVAVRLLTELRRLAAGPGSGALLGEALMAARRACLADGHAAVFALAVFGDTDWLLEETS